MTSCVMEGKNDQSKKKLDQPAVIDLKDIIKKGKLTVLVENSSTTYFVYRERPLGFEYELLKAFAEEIGVNLEIKIVNNLDSLIPMLNRGEGDIIACNYTITKERSKMINFSEPFMETHQVLVQRKPEGWEAMKDEEWKSHLVNSPTQLAGKTIHVWRNSSYYERLINLQEEIGDSILISAEKGNIGGEELIEMVAEGIIDYTISEANVAKVNERFFDNLYVELPLSVDQSLAFGLRKSSPLLKSILDQWLKDYKKTSKYTYAYHKYFEIGHITQNAFIDNSKLDGKNISKFDYAFKTAGKEANVDWRLVAAIAYQESKFNMDLVSFGGAYGIMQFMPSTGPTYGVYPDSPLETQINGGAKKIKADIDFWSSIKDEEQRLKFAIASYNAGRCHIQDAQNLAKKHGLKPDVWDDNVETMLLNLSKQAYYQDEVVRCGFLKGTNTYRYVEIIIDRYHDWSEKYH